MIAGIFLSVGLWPLALAIGSGDTYLALMLLFPPAGLISLAGVVGLICFFTGAIRYHNELPKA